jgi:uncharacterized protein (TIGR03905 family)
MPSFKPKGVCATQIDFDIDAQGLVRDVSFTQGCSGNAIGVARLAEGRAAKEIIELLKDISCGRKPTSCPAQLAIALDKELEAR